MNRILVLAIALASISAPAHAEQIRCTVKRDKKIPVGMYVYERKGEDRVLTFWTIEKGEKRNVEVYTIPAQMLLRSEQGGDFEQGSYMAKGRPVVVFADWNTPSLWFAAYQSRSKKAVVYLTSGCTGDEE